MNKQGNLFADHEDWLDDDAATQIVASVVFPSPPFGPYDYSVPAAVCEKLEPGARVMAPLGKRRDGLVGYCVSVGAKPVNERKLRPLTGVLDSKPLVTSELLSLSKWISDYYLCEWGESLECVLPAGVRNQAGEREVSYFSICDEHRETWATLKLPPVQRKILELLAKAPRPLMAPEILAAAECSEGPLRELRKKRILATEFGRISTVTPQERFVAKSNPHELNQDQAKALDLILAAVRENRHECFLMHGVTGSGKTEVYLRAIEEVVSYGKQAIVLVPEISLTPQTQERFRSRFDRVTVLHSHLSDGERHWHWRRIASGESQVVVGARSGIFAPTPRLGIVVLDEEHDGSFKQDSAPRYHARSVAQIRAAHWKCPLVLGSATPSLETFVAAKRKNITLLELPHRANGQPLPPVKLIDLRQDRSASSKTAIGRQLYQAMSGTLSRKEQIILLLNRRGFSTIIQCYSCGYVGRCQHCDITLTHHREKNIASCHYCDFTMTPPAICPDCKSRDLYFGGLGTERLEAEVKARFSEASVVRMDSDTMRKPGSHEAALDLVRDGSANILLGTQMVAKGLDFPSVTLVGIVSADTALRFPDFRAAEKTFQLVAQAAGRSGRGEKEGIVVAQSYQPDHPALKAAAEHDYERFARHEAPIRKQYGYPPYAQMIRVIIRGKDESSTSVATIEFAKAMNSEWESAELAVKPLGPAPCPIAKIKDYFRFHYMIRGNDLALAKPLLLQKLKAHAWPEGAQWAIDVDPMDIL